MKQYKLWISVYTGFKCIDGIMRYIDDAILVTRSEEELIALGATPINDKPECLCSCHKNGYNGTHDESRCLCHKPVREIEPIDLGDPIDPPFDIEAIEVKLNQLITSHNQLQKAVNSLKGE